mgnify:CR=1 FL=1
MRSVHGAQRRVQVVRRNRAPGAGAAGGRVLARQAPRSTCHTPRGWNPAVGVRTAGWRGGHLDCLLVCIGASSRGPPPEVYFQPGVHPQPSVCWQAGSSPSSVHASTPPRRGSSNDDGTATDAGFFLAVELQPRRTYWIVVGPWREDRLPTLRLSLTSAPRPPPPPRQVGGTWGKPEVNRWTGCQQGDGAGRGRWLGRREGGAPGARSSCPGHASVHGGRLSHLTNKPASARFVQAATAAVASPATPAPDPPHTQAPPPPPPPRPPPPPPGARGPSGRTADPVRPGRARATFT